MTPDQPSPYGPPADQPAHGYPAPGYGAPGLGYGPSPSAFPFPQAYWPNGPLRPPAVTASGVLGIVTGGLTAAVCLMFFGLAVSGGGDGVTMVTLVCGVPCAVGLLIGGIRLLGGHLRGILLCSSLAAVAVLLLALVVGIALYDGEDVLVVTIWIVVALPFPVVTAALVAQRSVKGWTEDPRLG